MRYILLVMPMSSLPSSLLYVVHPAGTFLLSTDTTFQSSNFLA